MQNKFLKISQTESILAIAFFVIFCFCFIPSQHHEIRIHDTFDGNFSTRHVLVNSGHFFDTDPQALVPGIMNGLPRGVFPRVTEITSLLMYLFGSLGGYALTFILVRLLAFYGLYLFGRDHLKIEEKQKGLLMLVACAFACLPFFIVHGLTVAGIPLVLWAFLNIYKKQRTKISYFIFLLFVLWSNFVLVGFHIVFCLGLLAVYFSFKDKKIHFNLFLVLIFTTVMYVLSDYMLFYMHMFNSSYHSSRGEMERATALNIFGVVGGTVKSFFAGDYSTANYLGFIFALPFLYVLYLRLRNTSDERFKIFFIFVFITLFCAFFINLLDWNKFSFFYEKFSFAKEFNFKRFTSLLPGFFFVCVISAFVIINLKEQLIVRISSAILVLFLFFFIWRGNLSYNRSAFDTRGIKVLSEEQITFNEFFDPQLYTHIKKEIGSDTIKNVIHLGVSPSPSKYAGLNVLDDYQGDFPKEYKMEFRKVIEKEMDKSPKLKSYFDNWGSRCYMQSAGLFDNTIQQKDGILFEPNLSINTSQLKKMNCNYIISAILIGNAAKLSLSIKKVIVSAATHKIIFLYKIS